MKIMIISVFKRKTSKEFSIIRKEKNGSKPVLVTNFSPKSFRRIVDNQQMDYDYADNYYKLSYCDQFL